MILKVLSVEPVYRTVVADPPWKQKLGGRWSARNDKARPQRNYKLMELDEIMNLKIPAARKAHLYIWCVSQHVDWGYKVARAWGFEPIVLLTWCKPGVGCGRFQCNTEHVLVGRSGSRHGNPFGRGGRHAVTTRGTYFNWPRAERSSEKPLEFFNLVEKLSPTPRLELFARKTRDDWDSWGDEF